MRRAARGQARRKRLATLGGKALAGAVVIALACTGEPVDRTQGSAMRGKLEPGVAAQVGGERVTVAQVRALAEARGISLRQARDALVYDALLAAGARERGLSDWQHVRASVRGQLAHGLMAKLRERAEAEPITDEEVAKHTALHWLDMDRPVARQVVHAVVVLKEPASVAQREKADGVSKRVAAAVRGVTTPREFINRARAVDAQGLKVAAEVLPPVTEDGRQADLKTRPPLGVEAPRFDPSFVAAVFRLREVGGQVGDVRSSFGTHVIMLVEEQPALVLPLERRRELLTDEIRTVRIKTRLDELLEALASKTPHGVERNAEAVLSTLDVPEADGGS